MQFRKYILFCSLLWIAFASRADHAAGGYFEYTCLGNNQYEVNYYLLRDCDGVQPNENIYMYVYNTCDQTDCLQGVLMVPKAIHETVDYGCGNDCPGQGNNPGLQLARYTATITLPTQCESWIVSTSIQLRNEVDYCTPVANENYYTYCIINNTNDICNSSPRISGIPFAIGCTGQNGRSLFHVTDPDGTTLQYSFVAPQAGGCSTHQDMVFEGGASVNRPYPSSTDFDLGDDGSFTFQPNNLTGRSYFAVRVQEFNAANVLIAESVYDGMIFVSNDCERGSGIDFFDWSGTSGNTLTTSSVTEPLCGTFHLMPNDDSEFITNVTVEAPHFVDHSITYNGDGSATVDVCADFPDELLCQEIQASITVTGTTSDANCLAIVSAAGHKGYYYLVKEKGLYCPDNLYITNRNNQSGLVAPVSLRAEERIWVGDDMPPPYNPFNDGPEGPVIVPDNAHYIAGIEIILPACEDPANDCVTMQGDITLQIAPFSCSSECEPEPIEIYVNELFKCNAERLIAQVTGNGPFTYRWEILGQTFESTNSDLNVHDLVSEHNNGYIPYTLTVYDAAGYSEQYTGQILGTKRFYEPIKNNKMYENHTGWPAVYGPSGYYYAGNIGVYSGLPAYAWDDVNSSPPWYGATYMRLKVYGTTSNNVYLDYAVNLQNTDDWSLDNGEFFWNGRTNNTGACVDGQVTDIFTYILTARNCREDYFIDQVVIDVDEAASYHVDVCTTEPWNPVVTKSTENEDGPQYPGGQPQETRRSDLADDGTEELIIRCIPNPTQNEFIFDGNFGTLLGYRILDMNGKIVREGGSIDAGKKVTVSNLSAGIYTIVAHTSTGPKQLKLIKTE